jgi:hypothetical protein
LQPDPTSGWPARSRGRRADTKKSLQKLGLAARLAPPSLGSGLEDGVSRVVEGAGRDRLDGCAPTVRSRSDRVLIRN